MSNISNNMLQGRSTVTLDSISELDGLYNLNLIIDGQKFDSFLTKDGKYLFPQGIEIGEIEEVTTPPTSATKTQTPSVQKSDKPIAEAFVFSYCPYDLQFQKALLPVYELLKGKADIALIAIGAMHGEYEKQESLRQICIEEKYSKDKLWNYLKNFMAETKIGSCKRGMTCSDPLVEKIMTQLDIDTEMINDCMVENAKSIYTSQNDQARGLGISGSPTFVLNGERIQVSRSPEAIKEAICNAFNNPPEKCQQTLSTAQASPSFGAGTSSSSVLTV